MGERDSSTSELHDALTQLETSLKRAAEAAARIKEELPRIERISGAFAELESIIAAGREPGPSASTATPSRPSRPKLVVPGDGSQGEPRGQLQARPGFVERTVPALGPAAVPQAEPDDIRRPVTPSFEPEAHVSEVAAESTGAPAVAGQTSVAQAVRDRPISFRLQFESGTAPLDLRSIDDAVSAHPAVRDVALLDYDGRRATLKVWIAPPATPADVQQALNGRANQIAPNGHEVSIVALEDVA